MTKWLSFKVALFWIVLVTARWSGLIMTISEFFLEHCMSAVVNIMSPIKKGRAFTLPISSNHPTTPSKPQ